MWYERILTVYEPVLMQMNSSGSPSGSSLDALCESGPMSIPPRRRWWVLGWLALYVVAVAVVVLSPVSYADFVNAAGDWLRDDLGVTFFGSGWIEFGANVLMFVPLGFLLTLLFEHPWYGVALALVLSAGVELAQFFIPSREPSVRDVVANVLGAALGAALAWLIVLRRGRRRRAPVEAAV